VNGKVPKKKKKKKKKRGSQIDFENEMLDTAEQFDFQEIKSPGRKDQNDLIFEGGLKKVESTRDFDNSLEEDDDDDEDFDPISR